MKHTLADDASASPFGSGVEGLAWLYGLSVFRDLATTGESEAAASVLQQLNYTKQEKLTLGEIIQSTYEHNIRPDKNPREYEFKNELLRDVLSDGWDTAMVQFEQPCGDVRADMVAYYPQGGAHAYEIKTGRDSLSRLPHQIETYQRAYPKVTVVTAPDRVSEVAKVVPPQVGISVLDGWTTADWEDRLGILEIRPAQRYTKKLDVDVITAHLRTAEAPRAVAELGHEPAKGGYKWTRNREILAEYDAVEVVEVAYAVICRSRALKPHQVEILEKVPVALAARVVKFGVNKVQGQRLMRSLNAIGSRFVQWFSY